MGNLGAVEIVVIALLVFGPERRVLQMRHVPIEVVRQRIVHQGRRVVQQRHVEVLPDLRIRQVPSDPPAGVHTSLVHASRRPTPVELFDPLDVGLRLRAERFTQRP